MSRHRKWIPRTRPDAFALVWAPEILDHAAEMAALPHWNTTPAVALTLILDEMDKAIAAGQL